MDTNYNTDICSRWSSFLMIGIFLVLLGSLALTSSFVTTLATVFLFGLLLFAGGLTYSIQALWAPDWKQFFTYFFVGILSALSGWLMIANPSAGAVSLTLLLALFFLASGIVKIMSTLTRETEHKGWLVANGLLSVLLGILMVAQWPTTSLWTLGLFIGIDLLFSGWTTIMYSLMLKKRCSVERPVSS